MKAVQLLFFFFRFGLAISIEKDKSISQTPKRLLCPPTPGNLITCSNGCHGACLCAMVVTVTTTSSTYFADWDLKLSQVIQGPAEISIDSSITIPTVWSIQPQYPICYSSGEYENGIGSSLGLNINQSWNVYNNGSQYSVPAGQYGILVINPWTLRTDETAEVQVDPNCK